MLGLRRADSICSCRSACAITKLNFLRIDRSFLLHGSFRIPWSTLFLIKSNSCWPRSIVWPVQRLLMIQDLRLFGPSNAKSRGTYSSITSIKFFSSDKSTRLFGMKQNIPLFIQKCVYQDRFGIRRKWDTHDRQGRLITRFSTTDEKW